MTERQWPSFLNLLVGIWLAISPWVLGYAQLPSALWNNLIVGIAIAALAAYRIARGRTIPVSWSEFALGVWLWIAPMALGYSNASVAGAGPASGNGYTCGTLVALLALWALMELRSQAPASSRHVFSAAEPSERERERDL